MDIIRREDIDFSSLQKLSCRANSESELYLNDDILYKMFKNIPYRHIKRKNRKIELLSDCGMLDDAVIPRSKIIEGNTLSGYTMDYIKDALILFEFTKRSKSINDFLQLVYRVSMSLRKIHDDPRNIVVGDLSFSNIIFDENFRHYFIDFDSCMIDGIPADRISFLLDDYIKIRGICNLDINKNTDMISLMLCMLHTIFGEEIDNVSMYDYDFVSERVQTLRNMREFVVEIKKHNNFIPEVPYMDEVIKVPSRKKVRLK